MEIFTIMVVGRIAKQVKCEGYKIKVNKNSFLVFESKKHYKTIMELERTLFRLVNDVLKDYEYQYEYMKVKNMIYGEKDLIILKMV